MTDFAFGPQDRSLMWHILAVWAQYSVVEDELSPLRRTLIQQFQPVTTDLLLNHLRHTPPPIDLTAHGWLIGAPIPKQAETIPVVSAAFRLEAEKVVDAIFRVALVRERGDATIAADGWRFEQEEQVPKPAHPYAHAQILDGWFHGSRCLIHPPHAENGTCVGIDKCDEPTLDGERERVNETLMTKHPAFPLPVKTLSGLALALITSLYGAPTTAKMFRGDDEMDRADGGLRDDFQTLQLHREYDQESGP